MLGARQARDHEFDPHGMFRELRKLKV